MPNVAQYVIMDCVEHDAGAFSLQVKAWIVASHVIDVRLVRCSSSIGTQTGGAV